MIFRAKWNVIWEMIIESKRFLDLENKKASEKMKANNIIGRNKG